MSAILAALAFVIVSGLFIEAFAWLFRRKDRKDRERDYAQANATNEGMPEYLGRWPDDFQPKE